MNNKNKAHKIFSKDHECLDRTGDKVLIRLCDVEYKKDLYCGRCGHKSCWGVKNDCEYQPEMSYYCHNCSIVFIFVADNVEECE